MNEMAIVRAGKCNSRHMNQNDEILTCMEVYAAIWNPNI